MLESPTYVLGTGLSHDGSAVLLRDGRVCVAIEKERLTRVKHDGGNDSDAIQYCLDSEDITLSDVAVVVQCENFNRPKRASHYGPRLLADFPDVPLVDISHHLAHAYSVVGTTSFDSFPVLVIDGCGSPLDQCIDITRDSCADPALMEADRQWFEKDSFYFFDGRRLHTLYKDFSQILPSKAHSKVPLLNTWHSIGGFYAIMSGYCFGNLEDAGKLMGLAPFGRQDAYNDQAFRFEGDRLMVNEDWCRHLIEPASDYAAFQSRFQHYADLAAWAQQEVERAVLDVVRKRMTRHPSDHLCFTGGVALNAVANGKILQSRLVRNLYIEPAAGDNGIALGCAYYGWLEHLGRQKLLHDGDTCFGRIYQRPILEAALQSASTGCRIERFEADANSLMERVAGCLVDGKVVGWFQGGSEFGPRALGRRSILAHPGISGMQAHINRNIKRREDFRPFAPAVLAEDVTRHFVHGWDSPYMILVDAVRPEWRAELSQVMHQDGSARVQTVTPSWNAAFYRLLLEFKALTGFGVLLNTSLNSKGMPIVETPQEAVALFNESDMDVLVLDDRLLEKP